MFKKLLWVTVLAVFAISALTAIAVITFSPATPAEAAGGSFTGSGSQADPYFIGSVNDLKRLADDVNSGTCSYEGKYFLLKDDLDVTSALPSWDPIGTGDRPFKGVFDGGGYSITFEVNGNDDYAGLFGNTTGTITNLSATGTVYGRNYVGGIAGSSSGELSNIKFYGTVSATGRYAGGLAGHNGGQIDNGVNNANVSGTSEVGGIAGYSVTIGNCTNCGTVTAEYNVGGIAGVCEGQIYNCVNEKYSDVSSTALHGDELANAGGIAGKAADGIIGDCTNKAKVSGNEKNAGGIVGTCRNITVSDCVNEGTVFSNATGAHNSHGYGGIAGNVEAGNDQESVVESCTNRAVVGNQYGIGIGGITGIAEKCKVYSCINTARVYGLYDVGGIAGRILPGATVDSCTNSANLDADNQIGGIVGLQQESGRVYNCINTGTITASMRAGGITGATYVSEGATGISTIENCTNKGKLNCSNGAIGGIAGHSNAGISNCINEASVTGTETVGGIAGVHFSGFDPLTCCVNKGKVKGTTSVGGIVGKHTRGNIVKCLNTANVEGEQHLGGIAGTVAQASVGCIVSCCLNNGNVASTLDTTDSVYVGGIAGEGVQCQIIECGNTGKITAVGAEVGGLVGYARRVTFTNSYNRGIVYGYAKVGGIAGFIRDRFTAENCCVFVAEDNGSYDGIDCTESGDISHNKKVGGFVGARYNTRVTPEVTNLYWWQSSARRSFGWMFITGENSGEGYTGVYWKNDMKNKDTFAGFDFSKVWVIKDDGPVLRKTLNLSAAGGLGGSGGSGGTGGTGDPVLNKIYIGSPEAFKTFRNNVNNGNSYDGMEIYLACDLDLGGENWTPIGIDRDHIFNGSFYGGSHVIKGFYLNSDSLAYSGLFGACGHGSIRDICVYGSVTGSGTYVGGIAGFSYGHMYNCMFIGDVNCKSGSGYAGGLIGVFGQAGNYNGMSDCGHIGNVTSSGAAAGGVIGAKNFQFKVTSVFHAGGENSVSSTNGYCNIGAIIGETSQPQMCLYCIATEGSASQLFGKITGYNSPVQCAFLSAKDMGDPNAVGGHNFDIGYESGHTWGAGWNYPVLQQFGSFITLVPSNNKDDARMVWLLKDLMVMPSTDYTRDAYSFNSWNTKPAGDGKKVDFGDAVAQGDIFYGQWDTVDYNIEYVLNGVPGNASQTYNIESTDTLQILSREHYSFDGWKVIVTSGNWPKGQILAGGELLTGKYGGVTLQAKWSELPKYTVSWYTEDGDLINTTQVEKGTVPTHADPVKQGTPEFSYIFTGWDSPLIPVQIDTGYTATFTAVRNSYTITWKNDDGSVIDTTVVEYGETPAHADASKTNTAEYTYTFTGWTPEITPVGGAATYTATYSSVKNSYTITWKNEDGTVIDTTYVEYGKIPTHDDAVRENTVAKTYVFSGWTPNITSVTGSAEYTAVFSSLDNSYTITWKNFDGTVIDTTLVEYGKVPTHADASRDNTAEFTYTFTGWTPTVASVTGDAEYTAEFSSSKNSYTITWRNENGSVIDTTVVEYGKTPEHANASKTGNAEFTYTFEGWSPAVTSVTGDADYKATFSTKKNSCKITWKNDDGTVIDTTTVEYGKLPTHSDPSKESTAEFTYSFSGWSPEITEAVGDAEYIAVFSSERNKYIITFVNEDGSELLSVETPYGETPVYTGETPAKAADSQYTYTFSGWTPEITAVSGDATYTAAYTAADISEEVSYAADKDIIKWQLGSGLDVTVTVKQLGDEDNSFDDFKAIYIDSALLAAGDYTVTRGSTVIKILTGTLEKLTAGEHTLKILFEYGETTVKLEVLEAEKVEEDNNANNIWIPITVSAVVVAAAAAALVIVIKKKKASVK